MENRKERWGGGHDPRKGTRCIRGKKPSAPMPMEKKKKGNKGGGKKWQSALGKGLLQEGAVQARRKSDTKKKLGGGPDCIEMTTRLTKGSKKTKRGGAARSRKFSVVSKKEAVPVLKDRKKKKNGVGGREQKKGETERDKGASAFGKKGKSQKRNNSGGKRTKGKRSGLPSRPLPNLLKRTGVKRVKRKRQLHSETPSGPPQKSRLCLPQEKSK